VSESCHLEVRVVPNASRTEITGWVDGALKVRVQAPALDGRANEAVCAHLATRLGLPRRAVVLESGSRSRRKRVLVTGLSGTALQARLDA